ncbi:SCO family protein [Lysobacter niastensis]|uniref:SCO family protein n=1 Tax=Lysobacter niastensis TaxID=380629 RepID=A0ABS0BCM4_9GAMM|nr:SCO family protein [Lysobacter niastensis]MBF6025437.1 SCO family protein [Lysobacter niastensis]
MLPTWMAVAAVAIATVCGLHVITHGFHAVTSDQARQRVLAESPRDLPPIRLLDSHGQNVDLRQIAAKRPYTVVSLVYTQCTTLCLLTASGEAYLQAKLRDADIEGQVGLLTISFDPARDTPDELAQYARRVKADPGHWTIATVADSSDLASLLNAFGVVVLPDGAGGYTHNGALFLVDRRGRLFDALDPDAADLAFVRIAARVRSP